MTLQTIPEIISELDRIAADIASINARPFEDRIDLRVKGQDQPSNLGGYGNVIGENHGICISVNSAM